MSSATFQKLSHLTDFRIDLRMCDCLLTAFSTKYCKISYSSMPTSTCLSACNSDRLAGSTLISRFWVEIFEIRWISSYLLGPCYETEVRIYALHIRSLPSAGYSFKYHSRRAGVQVCVQNALILTPGGSTVPHLFLLVCLTTWAAHYSYLMKSENICRGNERRWWEPWHHEMGLSVLPHRLLLFQKTVHFSLQIVLETILTIFASNAETHLALEAGASFFFSGKWKYMQRSQCTRRCMLNSSTVENETNHENVQTSGVGSVFKVYNVNCMEKINLGTEKRY